VGRLATPRHPAVPAETEVSHGRATASLLRVVWAQEACYNAEVREIMRLDSELARGMLPLHVAACDALRIRGRAVISPMIYQEVSVAAHWLAGQSASAGRECLGKY